MKLVKSSEWWRRAGQVSGKNGEKAKIDTLVSNKERIFFIPENEDEKNFFDLDKILNLTGVPISPISKDPDGEWGWRFFANRTEQDLAQFADGIKQMMKGVYEKGIGGSVGGNKDSKRVLN